MPRVSVQGVGRCEVTGKRQYPTRKYAREVGRQRTPHVTKHGGKDGRLSAYRCDHCDYWHLGHLPPEVYRRGIDRGRTAGRR